MKGMTLIKISVAGLMLLSTTRCGDERKGTDPAPGTEISAGGDSYAQEFVSVGYKVVNDAREIAIPSIDTEKLLEVVKSTKVASKPELSLEGREVGAINYPDSKRIEMSRRHWDQITSDPIKKELLVLHEYLGVLGVDDKNYEVSGLMDRGKVCSRHPAVRRAIEMELKRECNRITTFEVREFVTNIAIVDTEIAELRPQDFKNLVSVKNLSIFNGSVNRLVPGVFEEMPSLYRLEILQDKNIPLEAASFKGLGTAKFKIEVMGKFVGMTKEAFSGLGGNFLNNHPGIRMDLHEGSVSANDSFEFIGKRFLTADLGAYGVPSKIFPEGFLKQVPLSWLRIMTYDGDYTDSQLEEIAANPYIKTINNVENRTALLKLNGKAGFTCKLEFMNWPQCNRP